MEVKSENSCGEKGRGFTNWQSPQCGAFSRIFWTKRQSPSYTSGLGAVVTNDWRINA